jgi:integrase
MNKSGRRRNGEGSIYQRKSDGRWVFALSLDNGKRKRIYGTTAEEVVERLAQARNQQRENIPFTDERLTVGHWLNTWLRNMKPPATSPKTWITYKEFVRWHLVPGLGHIRLVKLQPQHVRDFLSQKLDSGLSARTVSPSPMRKRPGRK